MYKKLSSKVLLSHPRLVVEEDEIELESGEKRQYLRFGNNRDGVVVIARNNDNQILFLREYSYVPNQKLQLPMGGIEQEEDIEIAANRELQEETDFKASRLTHIGSYFQNHRRSGSKGHVVLATELVQEELAAEKEEAGIEIVWIAPNDVASLIESGEIVDADTLSSLRIGKL